jgi:hypothetical protein
MAHGWFCCANSNSLCQLQLMCTSMALRQDSHMLVLLLVKTLCNCRFLKKKNLFSILGNLDVGLYKNFQLISRNMAGTTTHHH